MINCYIIYLILEPFAGFVASGHPIFYMVPFAFSSYLCFGIVLFCSIMYLTKKETKFDLILYSSTQTGVIIATITITIGMIWAKVEWGQYWDWTPRETATLIMWLAYVALLIFRDMIDEKDYEKRATLSAIFGILVFPSVPLSNFIVGEMHPEPQQTGLGEGLAPLLMLNFLFIGIVTLILIFLAFKVNKYDFMLKEIRKAKIQAEYENSN